MKKILYIIDRANFYGSERHVYDIVDYMKNNKNFNIEFLCFFKGELYEKIKLFSNVKINYFRLSWINIPIKFITLLKLIFQIKPDIIHCHQPKALFIGTLLGKILKIKVIVTFHSDVNLIKYSNRNIFIKYFVFWFHKVIELFVKKYSNKKIYLTKYALKKKDLKSFVIYNWVSRELTFPLNKKDIDLKEVIKILYVGSITTEKGYEEFIDFLAKCKKSLPLEINIVGDGNPKYIKKLLKKIENNKIEFKINFCGYQKNMKKFYQEADLFFLFSKCETFGLVYIEAMFYGLPIFCYCLPVLEELLPKENFIENDLFKQVLNLEKIIIDRELYKKISFINQIEARNKFNYNKNIKKLENLYLELSR